MDDQIKQLQEKVKKLEAARDQLGQGWLTTEREKARLSAAIDNLELGFIIADDYNKIIRQNGAVKRILGVASSGEWSIGELQEHMGGDFDLGASCMTCFHERKSAGPVDVVFDDKLIRIFLSPIILLKESVTVFGTAILVEDISRQKGLEKTRDEFLAVASHELKAPLTTIKLNSEKILSVLGNRDGNIKNAVNQIQDDTERLIEIVRDFVDLSRIESGRLPFKSEIFHAEDVIKEVVLDLGNTAKEKGITLRFDSLEEGFSEVIADNARVRQVLYNLVSNAVRFCEKGGVRVFIQQTKDHLKISVEDTGLGIDEETKKMLFKKFIKSEEGSGLGLYISKLLVEDMGGQIFLEKSEVGKGSTFAFTLPVASK